MTSVAIADRTINVPFHGDSLFIVSFNNEPYVPMKPVVEGMGMVWAAQFVKLKQRFAKGVSEIEIPSAGGKQAMTCLAFRKFAAWLSSINPNKVKSEIRDKVIQYQEECDDVLYEYFTKGEVTPRVVRKSTTEERTPLRDAVNMLVSKKHMMYPEAYALIHHRFQVSSLEQLTPEQIAPAIEYVHKVILEGELLERQNEQLALPISFPMTYFEQYRHVVREQELKSPWGYPPKKLIPNGDNPNPLGRLLGQLRGMGCEVEAALFQLLSLQHHLETMQWKIASIERSIKQ
ncbi:phage antirepressor N-terminal domain-containing protein [Escherichia coli]